MEMNPEVQLNFELQIPVRKSKVINEAVEGSKTIKVVSYNILANKLAFKYQVQGRMKNGAS